MSEKFDMKLVINEMTTPLLHTRLRAARSAQERAVLLRSLAESALRSESIGVVFHPGNVSVRMPGMVNSQPHHDASNRPITIASRVAGASGNMHQPSVSN
jgi:hypothetical protein